MVEHKEEKKEGEHHHSEHHISHHTHESFKELPQIGKVRKNPWVIATIVLAVLLLVIAAVNVSTIISKDNAAQKLLKSFTAQGLSGLTINKTEEVSGVYKVTFNYQGQVVPIYMTTDGKLMGSLEAFTPANSTATTNTPTQKDIPKSDKPQVNLFVFAYCPYGLQSEKGFIPVYNLLKNKVDFKITYIGAMHGPYEETETLRQLCIKKNYGQDKYMQYLSNFAVNTTIGACSSDTSCSKPLVEKLMTSMSINVNTINTCMTKDAPALYQADEALASQNGVSGSPSLMINGVDVQSGRDSASYLATICSAFSTAPAECSQTISSASPSAGFGGSTGTATGASC